MHTDVPTAASPYETLPASRPRGTRWKKTKREKLLTYQGDGQHAPENTERQPTGTNPPEKGDYLKAGIEFYLFIYTWANKMATGGGLWGAEANQRRGLTGLTGTGHPPE